MKKEANSPHAVVIIGAGFAGLGAAIRLRQSGVDDVVILERGKALGGTWRDNQYPGAACDIPSNLYSYSFAMNPNWTRGFSGSQEILDYMNQLAREHDLASLIRFNTNVTELVYDEQAALWSVHTEQGGVLRARTVVSASGPLSNASLPDIPGIDSYSGHKVHSARWDHDYDFHGKRVAVIGTGASAVQIVPELVKVADKVKVFQRTPGWVLPMPDFSKPKWNRSLFDMLPLTQKAVRQLLYMVHESMALGIIWKSPLTKMLEQVALAYLHMQVKDPWLRRQLTPDFTIGCKRVLMSSDYFPALAQPNCELVSWPIATLSEKGIRTAEGLEHQVDCIVFATGFDVAKHGSPYPVTGMNGRQLNDEWARGPQAYKSVNVSGYPNLFLTFGPNSGPGHNSALVYMESQIEYIVTGIRKILDNNFKSLDVRPEAQLEYNKGIQKRLRRTNWSSGCKSWYISEDGFNATMYPGFATQFRRQMKRFRLDHYQVTYPG
ncbi:MAG: NAD(P)/FAD-dependent oxidoreductase [Salinisphaeraceae bacterium]|nr:NAD(P)/FAD-dependent oxidoreductase [Salinisphaeraceae bacterium]